MKALFLALLAANLAIGIWLLLAGPTDTVREPGRVDLQIDPDRFHLLSDADVARLRGQAERKAAAVAPAATPRADAPAANVAATSCVEIGGFPSESAASKLRGRLADIGLGDRTSSITVDHATRLRISRLDAAAKLQIDKILKDFPKQQLERCAEAPGAH
jgi:hypothetical protein